MNGESKRRIPDSDLKILAPGARFYGSKRGRVVTVQKGLKGEVRFVEKAQSFIIIEKKQIVTLLGPKVCEHPSIRPIYGVGP